MKISNSGNNSLCFYILSFPSLFHSILAPFMSIPTYSCLIPFYSHLFLSLSLLFPSIPVSFPSIPIYSCLIPFYSHLFLSYTLLFPSIPVSFPSIPIYSCLTVCVKRNAHLIQNFWRSCRKTGDYSHLFLSYTLLFPSIPV